MIKNERMIGYYLGSESFTEEYLGEIINSFAKEDLESFEKNIEILNELVLKSLGEGVREKYKRIIRDIHDNVSCIHCMTGEGCYFQGFFDALGTFGANVDIEAIKNGMEKIAVENEENYNAVMSAIESANQKPKTA